MKRLGLATTLVLALHWRPAAAQQPSSGATLDSLLSTRISAASKYAQTAAEAPASVTIVTAEELRLHRFRNLQEVLEHVRGFYASNDRNYTYVGARGFGRPTDYNSRILLLVDGQTLNDETWGGAPFGSEIPINLDAVERIEVVRGPGSALYGTSAMFGVINVVLKTGTQIDGITTRVAAGTPGHREVAVVAGRALGTNGSYAVSGVWQRSDGEDLHFSEYDTAANGGVARGMDWERSATALATGAWRSVSASYGVRSRTKAIPTAPFGIRFGDSRAETRDVTSWGSIAVRREVRGSIAITARLFGHYYDYDGVYPYDTDPSYVDGGGSVTAGAEALAVWDFNSSNRLTLGSEFRRGARAEYWERQSGVVTADDQPFDLASVFLQNEMQLSPRFALVTGLRHDAKLNLQSATTPRIALIATPSSRTTVKVLYGEAFRAPSPAEAEITTSFYVANPSLLAERVRTVEIDAQHRIGRATLLSASIYRYRMKDLIEQVAFNASTLVFDNIASVDATGAEMQLDILPSGPVSGRIGYAFQNAHDPATHEDLTNSPRHIGHAWLAVPVSSALQAVIAGRVESGRRKLDGGTTAPIGLSDLTLSYSPAARGGVWRSGIELSLRTTNLFDVKHHVPAGLEHLQSDIPQPGRRISLRLDWRL